MNSLIKAMLSLDRRSKSMDDRMKRGGLNLSENMDTNKKLSERIEKQASLDKSSGDATTRLDVPESTQARSSKYLEIPSIRYNLISKSFEVGLERQKCRSLQNSRENSEEAGEPTSSPPSATKSSQSVDRASRISFFRLSKIGKRIRKKLGSSSAKEQGRSCDDSEAADDQADSDQDQDHDKRRWKSVSLRKTNTTTTTSNSSTTTTGAGNTLGQVHSAGSSFESAHLGEQLRRTLSASPVAHHRIHVSNSKSTYSKISVFIYFFVCLFFCLKL